MNIRPFSQACENNKTPILNHLSVIFKDCKSVLELGSGTGQHAVYFAEQMPWLIWQTSDRTENHEGIKSWIAYSKASNIELPIKLDVSLDQWPQTRFEAIFTANTCHIMHWSDVINMFNGVNQLLEDNAYFVVYGPFNYNNAYTSKSNEDFDLMLKQRNPESGLRDMTDIVSLAKQNQLLLLSDNAMPANNRLLVFQKQKAA